MVNYGLDSTRGDAVGPLGRPGRPNLWARINEVLHNWPQRWVDRQPLWSRSPLCFLCLVGYLVITRNPSQLSPVSFLIHPFLTSLSSFLPGYAQLMLPFYRPSPHPRASLVPCSLSGMEDFPPLFNTRIGATERKKIWFCSDSLSPKQIDEASESERDHLPPYLQTLPIGCNNSLCSPFCTTLHLTQNMHRGTSLILLMIASV